MKNVWFVSRQIYWPDGDHVVEIALGGLDYANPDMLSPQYDGEGETYHDPRVAVKAALDIAAYWRADCPDKEIGIATGYTMGMTMPFTPEERETEEKTLNEWAEKEYEKLPKCDVCGEIMGEISFTFDGSFGDEKLCSEHCAEKAYDDVFPVRKYKFTVTLEGRNEQEAWESKDSWTKWDEVDEIVEDITVHCPNCDNNNITIGKDLEHYICNNCGKNWKLES